MHSIPRAAFAAASAIGFALASAAQANTYVVSSAADSGPNTLRAAIAAANGNAGADTITFAIGSGLAGLGGALGIQSLGLDPSFPIEYLVFFLIVVSIGGGGSVKGALAASLLLGLTDSAGKYYIPQTGAFIIYVIMLLVMLWRPQGLFGRAA